MTPTPHPSDPTHHASIDAWQLGRYPGRHVFARPHNTPDTTPAHWCQLLDVWIEDTLIIGLIDWHGTPSRVHWLMTNRVQVELTPTEHQHAHTTDLGNGYRCTHYDPWADGPTVPLEHRQPAPPHRPPRTQPPATKSTDQPALFTL
ncbi:hypothetical protein B842_03445 [Corynebacterium humireducens NBRC 106098 = DSM 45392]|uniref:Uncharacterized protein n=1 Tax=Corynebacterium humireducens NBRC 106098 = DSM 45392 TaxID=1223515 RepID=A0A0B5D5Z8_9CORY|nr:hypothetical protein [Corynebacterium humireducens]AJE32542.1 hypothetical protein B842_03445 [Corynebacterium humireducens NBRC 106098 = DSM 45392]